MTKMCLRMAYEHTGIRPHQITHPPITRHRIHSPATDTDVEGGWWEAPVTPMASSEYLEWCHQVGIRPHGIEAAYVAHGWRGVVATQEGAEPGQTILEVPEDVLMSGRSALRDGLLSAALGRHQGHLSPVQVGGVLLMGPVDAVSMCQ